MFERVGMASVDSDRGFRRSGSDSFECALSLLFFDGVALPEVVKLDSAVMAASK